MISKQYIAEVGLKREAIESFDRYPFSLAAVRPLKRLEFHPAVTFFVGENGSGKSTLLEAIAVACGFNAEGGSKNFRFDTRKSHSELHRYLRIARGFPRPRDGFFLRAESFFNVATEIEKLDSEPGAGPPIGPSYGERPLHEQSHGESFLALLLNRFHAYIYSFSAKGIERLAYQATEHYRITRDFLSNPQRMLKVLLAP